MAVKIILVDDQPVPGLTLRHWLKKQQGTLQVVGEAVPGSPVLALIQISEPDVVLLDVTRSPDASLNTARLIRDHYPDLPIVAIGPASGDGLRAEAAGAGAGPWAARWRFCSRRPRSAATASFFDARSRFQVPWPMAATERLVGPKGCVCISIFLSASCLRRPSRGERKEARDFLRSPLRGAVQRTFRALD